MSGCRVAGRSGRCGVLTGFALAVIAGSPGGAPADAAKKLGAQGASSLLRTKALPDPGEPLAIGQGDRGEYTNFPPGAPERVVDAPDFVPVHFLEVGLRRQRAVGRVTCKENLGGLKVGDGYATGFLVSPSLFMTNNHVVPDKKFAEKVFVEFNYQRKADGGAMPTIDYEFAPDDFFVTSPKLDYTLIRVKPKAPAPSPPDEDLGHIALTRPVVYVKEEALIIVQHPAGRPKELVVRNNNLKAIYWTAIRYTTDTEPGSSGSPVFNFNWDLVGIHHAGGDLKGGKWVDNEGIKINAVRNDLIARCKAGDFPHPILGELGLPAK